MPTQRTYGLDLSPLDRTTYKKVKKQLDRVNMADEEVQNARHLRAELASVKKELGKSNLLVAELQGVTTMGNLLAKLAKVLGL